MRIPRDTPGGRVIMAVAGWAVRMFVGTVGRTWRIEVVEGREALAAVIDRGDPVILTFWHNRSVIAAPLVLRHLHRKDFSVTLMASGSRDGEVVARAVRGWGVPVVRGSATRGGRAALWGAYRALRANGSSPLVVPDGPTGPAYAYKVGVLHLARLSGVGVLPLGFAADRYWTLRSWDRLMVPRPFARVAVAVAEPQAVARRIEGDALEQERIRQEALLNRLTTAAQDAVGDRGPADRPLPLPGSPELGDG